jgi:hypothetical protein
MQYISRYWETFDCNTFAYDSKLEMDIHKTAMVANGWEIFKVVEASMTIVYRMSSGGIGQILKPNFQGINRFKILGDHSIIYLERKHDEDLECRVDTKNLARLLSVGFKWSPHFDKGTGKYYAEGKLHSSVNPLRPHYKMHRFIMNAPKDTEVDHLNHDTLENLECNLEVVTKYRNMQNRLSPNCNNLSSGARCVSWNKKSKKWKAEYRYNGKRIYVGAFDNLHEARDALKKSMEQNNHISAMTV